MSAKTALWTFPPTPEQWERTVRRFGKDDAEEAAHFYRQVFTVEQMSELERRVRIAMAERPDIGIAGHMMDHALAIKYGSHDTVVVIP